MPTVLYKPNEARCRNKFQTAYSALSLFDVLALAGHLNDTSHKLELGNLKLLKGGRFSA